MKKLIVLSLTMMLSFSLAACGSSDKDTNGGASKETTDTGSDSNAGDTSNSTADGDLAYVKDKGTLVVGITDFEPMDYKDADGNWIGFDADMAKAFAESLGVTAEFVEIDWDNKIMELDGKTIDCVWNGMTLLEDVKTATTHRSSSLRRTRLTFTRMWKALRS